MKVALLLEDRDSGQLFLDLNSAPDGARIMDLTLADDVAFCEIQDEAKAIWLMRGNELRVVKFEDYDFENVGDDEWFPIPTPSLMGAER